MEIKLRSSAVSPTGQQRPDDRGPLGVTGLVKARGLVKEILDQVTLHDCPPINDTLLARLQNQSNVQTKSKKEKRQSSISSSISESNTTMTTMTSISHSQVSFHSSGIPRPISRQRHVLPTILSPSVSAASNNQPKFDVSEENLNRSLHDNNGKVDATNPPSPTSADVGDPFLFDNLSGLSSPSSANGQPGHSFGQDADMTDVDKDCIEPRNNIPLVGETPPNQVRVISENIFSSPNLPPPPPVQSSESMRKHNPGSGAEVIMGNLSLAALCQRTLESVSNELDLTLPKPLLDARVKDVSISIQDSESKDENISLWQKEVEMVDLGEKNHEIPEDEKKHALGSSRQKPFFSLLDDDNDSKLLVSNSHNSVDGSDFFSPEEKSLTTSQEESEFLKRENEEMKKSELDTGIYLSAVDEGNEEEETEENINASTLAFEPSVKAATASPESKLTLSPEQAPQVRMQMYGSEYARHLSSQSPFSPAVPRMKQLKVKKTKKLTTHSVPTAASYVGGGSVVQTNEPEILNRNEALPEGLPRSTNYSVSTMSSASFGSSSSNSIALEDASEEILSAAITDIVVTHGKEMPPKGYYRISLTSNGTQMDTLKQMSTGGNVLGRRKLSSVHLNVKKEPKWDRAVQRPCVSALTVIFPDRNEFVPPGFCVVRKHQRNSGSLDTTENKDKTNDKKSKGLEAASLSLTEPANLNFGTSGERVFLCYRRSREGNPITGLIPLQPSSNEAIPEGYTVIERSPRNFIADINSKAGPPVFLAFRQRLANLETLRPLPLVLSIHCAQNLSMSLSSKGKMKKRKGPRLSSYYCTGGTVVPAEIGRYHIMDRSTHPMISPSSVSNRLTLIQASRLKRSTSTNDTSLATETASIAKGLLNESDSYLGDLPSSEQSFQPYPNDNGSLSSDAHSTKESVLNGIINLVSSSMSLQSQSDHSSGNGMSVATGALSEEKSMVETFGDSSCSSIKNNIFASKDNVNLQACVDAMGFIPCIEAPKKSCLNQADEENMKILLQARVAVITPLLTACYTQHGCSSLLVVEGLSKLLTETDFFLQDVATYEDPFSSDRLTILDLAVQVVCDMATCTARETIFLPCIEFVSQAFYYAEGNLSTRTIGYVIRFYLFVFYFGASIPTSSCWPKNITVGVSKRTSLDEANDIKLLSEHELEKNNNGYTRGYIPGGAPQAGALALKELIKIVLAKSRKMSSMIRESENETINTGHIGNIMNAYVSSIVDGAIQKVDVANFTQLALHQIHRSGGSELFWHDMLTACGSGLFPIKSSSFKAVNGFFITSFSILASLVKVASGNIRKLTHSIEPVPRDLSTKLLSLELIHHFLVEWGRSLKFLDTKISRDKMKKIQPSNAVNSIEDISQITTVAYNIRRLVVPCLLSNTKPALEDVKIFRRVMKIVTELWCNQHIRHHMKVEMGVLIEHFILKILRLGPQVLPPKRLSSTSSSLLNDLSVSLLPQQVCAINELKIWFQLEPRDILELYMNFDQVDAQSSNKNVHLLPSSHWKITQQLCGALCTLTEQCTDIISEQIRLTRIDLSALESQSVGSNNSIPLNSEEDLREMTHVREGARYLQERCFDTMGQITRSMMLCAAASSGANYDLLSKLREKQRKDELLKDRISRGKENIPNIQDDNQSESSMESYENMKMKSISNLGNVSGGILNKRKDHINVADAVETPDSPRSNKLIPPSATDSEGDIVEYWQTSIAAERRKALSQSSSTPRGKTRIKGTVTTPPRSTKVITYTPSVRSPKLLDDVSVLSMTEDSMRNDPQQSQKMEDSLNVAFEIMREKSLKKAFDYLIACNFLSPSPKDIASFLRLYQSRIDNATLGEFLGEGGKDGDEKEHFNLIRFHYVSAISFVGMNVEQGLRYFLTNCGFKLPGEAQKIDRLMTTFSQCYWEDNAGDHGKCPFHDEDTVFLISFAIIMLNTDLHKTSMFAAPPGQSAPKQKQRKKMTKQEFLNNLRGVDNSEDLSKDYLSDIYDSIEANPIAIYRSNENPTFHDGTSGAKTLKFSSNEFGHIIQGNTDLAGMLKHLLKNVKLCEELLRGLSSHEHPYLTLKNQTEDKKSRKQMLPEELVHSAFSSTWHHFHGTINSALDSAHLDPKGLENCLDVLMYALCTTICLDMTVERNAFATQLVRVKYFRENRGLEEETTKQFRSEKSLRTRDHLDFKHDSWFMRIEKAVESYNDNAKVTALDEVDTMFQKLHASLQVDSTFKRQMMIVSQRICNGQILLNDPTRYFVKDGELVKRCNRTGRSVKYTFFLFSDVLVYARKSGSMFRIHGELPLHLMKIMDLSTGSEKKKHSRSFHLIHPRKSFVVFAKTEDEKGDWLKTINIAIGREVRRKARIEGARQASAGFDR